MEPDRSPAGSGPNELGEQVRRLAAKVEELSRRVDDLARGRRYARAGSAEEGAVPQDSVSLGDTWSGIGAGLGQTGLLSAMATVCFLLVVALVLRTLTESGVVDRTGGPLLGMAYSAVIMGLGWFLLAKGRPLGPIFTVSGTMLMLFIIVEAHQRFGTLSDSFAFSSLALTLIAMGLLGLRQGRPALLCVTVLGATAAGIALGLRETAFPWLGGILILATFFSYKASRIQGCSGLRWLVLAATALYVFVWADRVLIPGPQGLSQADVSSRPWLLPIVCGLAVTYAFLVVRRSHLKRTPLGAFDVVSVVGSALAAYSVAWLAAASWQEGKIWVCVPGLAVAAALVAMGVWLGQRELGGGVAVGAFCLAGAVLWLAAALGVTGIPLVSVLLWSVGALAVAIAGLRAAPVFRWTSYGMQAAAAALAAASGAMAVPPHSLAVGVGGFSALCALALIHYGLFGRDRGARPPPHEVSAAPADAARMIPFLACLLFAFGALRLVLHAALLGAGVVAPGAFPCAQSVLINLGALALVGLALYRGSKEMLGVAVLVGCVGAVKVFGVDLVEHGQGIPLVLSVFSFGIATAVGSVALRRFTRQAAPPEGLTARPRAANSGEHPGANPG